MPADDLTRDDIEQLRELGIPADEARRQLGLLERPPSYARLVRPCTVGDGILRLRDDEIPELHALHAAAAAAGRFTKFVPASGAASRMFRDLLHFQCGPGRGTGWDEIGRQADSGDQRAATLVRFMDSLDHFAFRADLDRVLRERGAGLDSLAQGRRYEEILDGLLDQAGLNYDARPKGMLRFHSYPDGDRTSFEEHLVESIHYIADDKSTSRQHLTVSPEHAARFRSLLSAVREAYERRYSASFEVGFSFQKPSTDTLAVDRQNRPLRDPGGRLVLRPGGHGALIENLDELHGDLVYVKNIDNIQPEHRHPMIAHWKRALGGYLVRLQREVQQKLRELRRPDSPREIVDDAIRFACSRLQVELNGRLDPLSPPARRAFLVQRLDRPLRVCGVVANRGEPGGGPFWVRGRDGLVGPQIVEGAEIDPRDEDQRETARRATHFNPVDLVCAVRDAEDRPYDLRSFLDPEAVIVSAKSSAGVKLKALERPGLWNGAMARWNTLFVEVPLETFGPVKTVLDLLRPEHQPEK